MIDKLHIKKIIKSKYRELTDLQLAEYIADYINKKIQADDPRFNRNIYFQDRHGNFQFMIACAFAEVLEINNRSYVIVIAEHHAPQVFEYGDVIVNQYKRIPLENVL